MATIPFSPWISASEKLAGTDMMLIWMESELRFAGRRWSRDAAGTICDGEVWLGIKAGLGEAFTVPIEMRSAKLSSIPWAHLRLPPFPQVAIRILQMANNENVQLHQLCDLIATDPAFASEVLTVANSILYAPRFPASSIMQAISVLGANHLQGMCLTVGVRAYLGKSLNLPAMRDLWRHNLACALVAEQLASMGSMDKAVAYTSGILHDVGRFALGVIQPKEYAALLATYRGTAVAMLERERELFGWDHCEAGIHLISSWKLPSAFDAIVSEHHVPRLGIDSWGMADLIKVSCRMADAAGFPAFRGCEITPYPELLGELPAEERGQFHADAASLSSEVANSIHAIESA